MQRNQWSRRKPSTKPETSGFGEPPPEDTQPGDGPLGEAQAVDEEPMGTQHGEAWPGQTLRGEAPPGDADRGPPLRGAASSEDADGRPPKRSRAASSPRNIAIEILARREHSVLELREKLLAREFPPDDVEQTLSALTADGLLSEQRFIDSFLASYTRRGHGPLWLRAELQRRGITSAEIAAALAGQEITGQPVDWPAQARTVRENRFGPAQPLDYKERARQSRFLQYRGFSSEQVRQAFDGGEDD